jgi:hypothetical protein
MGIAGLGLRRGVLGCLSAAVFGLVVFPGAAGADFTIAEGKSFSGTVVDIGGCSLSSATIYWGDGTPTSAGVSDGGTGVQGSHIYADERTANGNVSYTCSNMVGTQTAYFTATVTDAPLTAGGANVSGTAGQPVSGVVAHFSDANPAAGAGDFSAQIAWGDGSKTFGTVAAAPTGGFDVSGTHTYDAAGSYAISTSVTDIGGSTGGASSVAQIATPSGPPVARLTVTPNPTCTDVLTNLDASASSAPAGIVKYRFEYFQPTTDSPSPDAEDVLVYDGSGHAAYTTFTWNRAPSGRGAFDGLADNGYVEGFRDPADVKVTVTDARGATATATVHVTFVQGESVNDRTGCPPDFSPPYSFPFGKPRSFPKMTVSSSGVTTILPCRGHTICIGSLAVTAVQAHVGSAAATRRTAPVIAATTFRIAPGKDQRVHARLTKTGRRLLRGGKRVRARFAIDALAPKGNTVRRFTTITLRLPRHR